MNAETRLQFMEIARDTYRLSKDERDILLDVIKELDERNNEDQKEEHEDVLSVANDIKALALINIQDIFRFTLSAKDDEIEERYGTEEAAVRVAEKYLDIAMRASMLEYDIKGWSITYTQPIKDSDERMTRTECFFDRKEGEKS